MYESKRIIGRHLLITTFATVIALKTIGLPYRSHDTDISVSKPGTGVTAGEIPQSFEGVRYGDRSPARSVTPE